MPEDYGLNDPFYKKVSHCRRSEECPSSTRGMDAMHDRFAWIIPQALGDLLIMILDDQAFRVLSSHNAYH
jgi:hypothetical protein